MRKMVANNKICSFFRNRIEEKKRKKAERKKNCPLAKIICCGLVCSLIAAGIAILIGGLILMRQGNTSITTVESMMTILVFLEMICFILIESTSTMTSM